MSEPRRPLTLPEALQWRRNWSEGDKAFLRGHFTRLGIVSFESAPQDTYLHAKDGDGHTRMYINPGYVEFLPGTEPPDAQRDSYGLAYITLSTFMSRGPAKKGFEVPYKECPKHPGMALPASGVCDDCA